MEVCQIALNTMDMPRMLRWYERVFGMRLAKEPMLLEGRKWAIVPDLPGSAKMMLAALVDRRELFNFEVFEFEAPRMRAIEADWRPCDIGYATIVWHVADFDDFLLRLIEYGGRPLLEDLGSSPNRRLCLRDPDGLMLEVVECAELCEPAKGREAMTANVAGVGVSVADLERARRFWIDIFGFREARAASAASPSEDHHLALSGAARDTLVVEDDRGFRVALRRYHSPRPRPRPAGWLLSDQGILNLGIAYRSLAQFDDALERVRAGGYRINSEPWVVPGIGTVVYVNDDQGFSVELLYVESQEMVGFVPLPVQGFPRPSPSST